MPLLDTPSRPAATRPGASAHSHGMPFVPEQSRAERRRSFLASDFPRPTGREEEWRFTPMARLAGLLDDAPSERSLEWDITGPDAIANTGDQFILHVAPVLPGRGGYFHALLEINFAAGGSWQIDMPDCTVK